MKKNSLPCFQPLQIPAPPDSRQLEPQLQFPTVSFSSSREVLVIMKTAMDSLQDLIEEAKLKTLCWMLCIFSVFLLLELFVLDALYILGYRTAAKKTRVVKKDLICAMGYRLSNSCQKNKGGEFQVA